MGPSLHSSIEPSPRPLAHAHSFIPKHLFTATLRPAYPGHSGSGTHLACSCEGCSPVGEAVMEWTDTVQDPMCAVGRSLRAKGASSRRPCVRMGAPTTAPQPAPTPSRSSDSWEPRRGSTASSSVPQGWYPGGWAAPPSKESSQAPSPVTNRSDYILGSVVPRNSDGQAPLASRNLLTWANVEKPTANTRQY